MFLAITSIGWGFNWPVTKFLLGELPPLTLRGVTGVIGALLLAALALIRRQSLKVPREIWPRLVIAAILNVTGWMVLMGLALLWLPASEAALIAYTMPVWASLIAWPVLGERPTLLRTLGAGDGLRRPRLDHGRQRHRRQRREAAGHHHGAGRLDRLCRRHGVLQEATRSICRRSPGAAWQIGIGCLPISIVGLAVETSHLERGDAARLVAPGLFDRRRSSASPMSAGSPRCRACRPRSPRSAPWPCR